MIDRYNNYKCISCTHLTSHGCSEGCTPLKLSKKYVRCKSYDPSPRCAVSTLSGDGYESESTLPRRRHSEEVPTPLPEDDTERDPTGKTPNEPGAKLDAGKPMAGLLEDFSLALMAVAEVATFGAKKYSRCGWRQVEDGIHRYRDAGWRHRLKGRYEELDSDSGLLHKSHEAWNTLAELELILLEKRNQNQE